MRPLSALLRAILCVIFPIGLLWSVVSDSSRSLQDVLLRTSVIYDWNVRVPPRQARKARQPKLANEIDGERSAVAAKTSTVERHP
jgi:hypothetical protein